MPQNHAVRDLLCTCATDCHEWRKGDVLAVSLTDPAVTIARSGDHRTWNTLHLPDFFADVFEGRIVVLEMGARCRASTVRALSSASSLSRPPHWPLRAVSGGRAGDCVG